MDKKRVSRREFMRAGAVAAVGAAVAACQPQTVIVEKEKVVTQVVKETVEVQVEKEVTKVVEQKVTVEVVKEVQVTPVPTPSGFSESPMLAGMDLPPLAERMPAEPMVVPIREEVGETVGQYGGQLDSIEWRASGGASCTESRHWNPEGAAEWDYIDKLWVPNIAEWWQLSDDFKSLTVRLRRGIKWSDGMPLTTEDVRFWWEDGQLNEELTPRVAQRFAPTGEPATFVFEDDFTFRIDYIEPYVPAADDMGFGPWAPKHYLKEFHITYNPKAGDLAKDEGYGEWWENYTAHASASLDQQDWDLPLMAKWITKEADTTGTRFFERNPYYWKVDPEGNQLPYVDKYVRHIVASQEVVEAKGISGEYNLANIGGQSLELYPVFKENEAQAGYVVRLYPGVAWGALSWCFNYTSKDPVLREIFNDLRFRKAMSYAINREEYNDIFHLGLATIRQGLPPPTWSFYEEGMDQYYIEYDVDLANELLDEMGLKWDENHEWRLKPNGERLTLYTETSGENQPFGLVLSYWKEVGLEVNVKPVDQALYREHLLAGDLDIGTWGGGGPTEVAAHGSQPMRLIPPWHWASCCALAGLPWWEWYDSGGELGEEPPQIIKDLFAALDRYYAAPLGSEAYLEAGKEMVRINAENLWWFIVVGLTPAVTAVGKEVRNIREGEGVTFDVCVAPWTPELLWIEQ